MHLACIKSHAKVVRILIKKGANSNCRDFDESTPLHCASESGCIEAILCLLREGNADPTLKNKFGYTPSDIAMNFEARQVFQGIY